MEQPRKAVVVTGFGPFGEHTVNASWIAVQELEKLGLGDSVDLHVYEIPVEYKTVQRLIPALWEKHSPQVPLRLRLLYLSVPESRPLSLCSRAPSGQALQCRPAGPGTSGHHRGDAGRPRAVRRQTQLLPQTLIAAQASQDLILPGTLRETSALRGLTGKDEPISWGSVLDQIWQLTHLLSLFLCKSTGWLI
ncbi:pyroglutamyl-peptidase 1 isoform X2 [Kogia breviceps]|uniref:pyroglutamyl-peptidase 1 isoform X2 n=1 Tax=Kogia breviceps TaxID=27615 RepID=UPI00279545D6|nr:pyroglutamyl-peptidase 1 isoform X5 [Kogia breviceps]